MAPKERTRAEQERTRVTKQQILRAALQAFAAVGFEGASTRGIADEAGVKHTLITHHFGSKEALWKATAAWVFDSYEQRMQDRRAGLEGVEEPAVLRLLLREFVYFCAEVPAFHRFMMQANQSDTGRLEWLVDTYLRPGAATEMDLLSAAQSHGLFPEGDTLHMRYLFIGAVTSIFTFQAEFSLLSQDPPNREQIIERHVDYVLSLFAGGQQD